MTAPPAARPRGPARSRAVLLLAVALGAGAAAWRVAQQLPWPTAFRDVPGARAASGPGPSVASASAASTLSPAAVAARAAPELDFASSDPGAAVHAASAVVLTDGRLRATWFSGSREGASDVVIRSATLDPATGRWSPEQTVLTRPQLQLASWRWIRKVGNPVVARGPDGRLNLYVVAVTIGGWAGSSITRWISDDEGTSWHSPRRLVTSPFLNLSTLVKGQPVAYADGRIGLPVYHELIERYPEWLLLGADGRVQDRIRLPHSATSLQPVVRVLDERRAELWLRHAAAGAPPRVQAARTEDAGAHWTAPMPTPLPNPNAAVSVLALQGGATLLAFNDSQRGRGNLSLAWASAPARGGGPLEWRRLGVIEGLPAGTAPGLPPATWRERLAASRDALGGPAALETVVGASARQLCPAGPAGPSCNLEFSYPALAQTPDGQIHLLYTWHRSMIRHVRIPPAWIDAAAASGPPAVEAAR